MYLFDPVRRIVGRSENDNDSKLLFRYQVKHPPFFNVSKHQA